MGVSSANCVSGFPLPLSFPKPTGSVSWEAFHPLSLAVRTLRSFGFRFWTFPLGCSIAATRPPFFPMGFASMRFLRPKLSPSRGSMQISDLWILRFETHFHFRILAGFGIALCRLSGLGAIPLAAGGRRIRAYPFSSGVHRFLAPLRPCPLFLPLPAEILRFAFRKKQVYGKRVPVVFFVWFLGVLRRVSADTAPEAAIFPLCLCRSIVGFFRSSGCCVLRVFRASAPALPPIPASPEEFRFQGFLLIGRAASLALLLGLPPAVFSPSDDFFELPLSRSLMQPLCCIRIKHTLSRLLRGQFPEAVGTLPLAISAFSPFAIGSAPFPFSCLYYSMPFAVCQQESFCVYLLCIYNYLRALLTSKFP